MSRLDKYIQFTLSEATYSTDDFNAKFKAAFNKDKIGKNLKLNT